MAIKDGKGNQNKLRARKSHGKLSVVVQIDGLIVVEVEFDNTREGYFSRGRHAPLHVREVSHIYVTICIEISKCADRRRCWGITKIEVAIALEPQFVVNDVDHPIAIEVGCRIVAGFTECMAEGSQEDCKVPFVDPSITVEVALNRRRRRQRRRKSAPSVRFNNAIRKPVPFDFLIDETHFFHVPETFILREKRHWHERLDGDDASVSQSNPVVFRFTSLSRVNPIPTKNDIVQVLSGGQGLVEPRGGFVDHLDHGQWSMYPDAGSSAGIGVKRLEDLMFYSEDIAGILSPLLLAAARIFNDEQITRGGRQRKRYGEEQARDDSEPNGLFADGYD